MLFFKIKNKKMNIYAFKKGGTFAYGNFEFAIVINYYFMEIF